MVPRFVVGWRRIRLTPPAAILAMVLAGAPAMTLAAPERLISADEGGVTFEVDVDYTLTPSRHLEGHERLSVAGFGPATSPGEPGLPSRLFIVALPPDGDYRISSSVLQADPLGVRRLEPIPFPVGMDDEVGSMSQEYRVDAALYNNAAVTAGVSDAGVSRIRHQRVLAIRVNPATYDPRTGQLTIARRIRIDVAFDNGGRQGLLRRPSRQPVQESPYWDRVLSNIVVNPEPARRWRTKAIPQPPGASALRAASALAGPLVKLRFEDTGLHRVRASAVIAAGFPGGTSVANLHLFIRSYDEGSLSPLVVDVPLKVVEDPAGIPGVFDGDDFIVFFGRGLRDDPGQRDPIAKFSDYNVYWLGSDGGPRIAQKSVSIGAVPADLDAATFPVTRHIEDDFWFQEDTRPGQRDFYYYNSYDDASYSVPFTLGAIDPSGTAQLTAQIMGNGPRNDRTITVQIINSSGTISLPNLSILRDLVVTYQQSIPASQLVEGVNTFRIGALSLADVDALLNWIELEYDAPYRATGDELSFNSGSLTDTDTIAVSGLSRDDVWLFDVTDPAAPVECTLTAGHFFDVGQTVLAFVDDFPAQRDYVLEPFDQIDEIAGADIVGDEPSSIIGSAYEGGVDVLVISHADYIAEMQRWVSYRRAQGYRVFMVDVAEVFDEFSGGLPQPLGMRRFANHFFQTGGASFLVLVGDASEDNKRVHNGAQPSAPNFVPTESFSEYIFGSGFNTNEVVTSDKWLVTPRDFIANLNDGSAPPLDFAPNLMVGRLPAGNLPEMQRMINKILAFEAPSPGDFWRRRVLRIADDTWVGSFTICPDPSQDVFEEAEEAAAVITEQSIPGGYDVIRFYLSNRIDHPPGCVSTFQQQQRTLLQAKPVLFDELNQGATVVSFQAHMNRSVICHEHLFISADTGVMDQNHRLLTNVGRPFLLFAFGCHLSDYALHREFSRANKAQNDVNGDCISELILHWSEAGAVSTYGSTGFEYLNPNFYFTPIIARRFYESPPTDLIIGSNKTQARWIFGELLTLAEIDNLVFQRHSGAGGGGVGQVKRYHLLGDPLLRIEGGPPRFEVTVNNSPFQSGDAYKGPEQVSLRAVITDEVAIERLGAAVTEPDGGNVIQDLTGGLTVTPLVDQSLDAARQYEVTLDHTVEAANYDLVVTAEQAADTTGSNYQMAGRFVMQVRVLASLSVNGRPVSDGDFVPQTAEYQMTVEAPINVSAGDFSVTADGDPVAGVSVAQVTPGDSTIWQLRFRLEERNAGPLAVSGFLGTTELPFQLTVSSEVGLRDVVAFPNPFRSETQFVFTNELPITSGRIDIFTASGRRVRRIDIPSQSLGVGQNAVRWDGRDHAGDAVANGVYLFVINIDQSGQRSTTRGKLSRLE